MSGSVSGAKEALGYGVVNAQSRGKLRFLV